MLTCPCGAPNEVSTLAGPYAVNHHRQTQNFDRLNKAVRTNLSSFCRGTKLDTKSAAQLWVAALGQLELEIPRPNYETWLKNTAARDVNDGVLTISTPNAFTAEMLEKRLYASIERAVEQVAHEPLEVRFAVRDTGGSASPGGGRFDYHDEEMAERHTAPPAATFREPASTAQEYICTRTLQSSWSSSGGTRRTGNRAGRASWPPTRTSFPTTPT